jgi:hypothetical protein
MTDPLSLIVAHNLRVLDPIGNRDPMRPGPAWRVTAHHKDGVRLSVVVMAEDQDLAEAVRECVRRLESVKALAER